MNRSYRHSCASLARAAAALAVLGACLLGGCGGSMGATRAQFAALATDAERDTATASEAVTEARTRAEAARAAADAAEGDAQEAAELRDQPHAMSSEECEPRFAERAERLAARATVLARIRDARADALARTVELSQLAELRVDRDEHAVRSHDERHVAQRVRGTDAESLMIVQLQEQITAAETTADGLASDQAAADAASAQVERATIACREQEDEAYAARAEYQFDAEADAEPAPDRSDELADAHATDPQSEADQSDSVELTAARHALAEMHLTEADGHYGIAPRYFGAADRFDEAIRVLTAAREAERARLTAAWRTSCASDEAAACDAAVERLRAACQRQADENLAAGAAFLEWGFDGDRSSAHPRPSWISRDWYVAHCRGPSMSESERDRGPFVDDRALRDPLGATTRSTAIRAAREARAEEDACRESVQRGEHTGPCEGAGFFVGDGLGVGGGGHYTRDHFSSADFFEEMASSIDHAFPDQVPRGSRAAYRAFLRAAQAAIDAHQASVTHPGAAALRRWDEARAAYETAAASLPRP